MINRDTLLGAALGAGGFYLWTRWEERRSAAAFGETKARRAQAVESSSPFELTFDPAPAGMETPFTESGVESAAAAAGMSIEEWEIATAGGLHPAEFQVAGQAVPNRTHRMGMRPARSNPDGKPLRGRSWSSYDRSSAAYAYAKAQAQARAAKERRRRGRLIRARFQR